MEPTVGWDEECRRPLSHRLLHIAGVYIGVITGFLISLPLVAFLPGGGNQNTVLGQALGEPFWFPEILARVSHWVDFATNGYGVGSLSWRGLFPVFFLRGMSGLGNNRWQRTIRLGTRTLERTAAEVSAYTNLR
jgi:hypothetical protein